MAAGKVIDNCADTECVVARLGIEGAPHAASVGGVLTGCNIAAGCNVPFVDTFVAVAERICGDEECGVHSALRIGFLFKAAYAVVPFDGYAGHFVVGT